MDISHSFLMTLVIRFREIRSLIQGHKVASCKAGFRSRSVWLPHLFLHHRVARTILTQNCGYFNVLQPSIPPSRV